MEMSDQLLASDWSLVKEEHRGLFSLSLLWWQHKGRLSGAELSLYIYIYIYIYIYVCVCVCVCVCGFILEDNTEVDQRIGFWRSELDSLDSGCDII